LTKGKMPNPGTLYIVSTPIGNLEDITLRALRVLREVNVIAAEDTRQSRKLLSYYEIKTPLISYREENREKQGKYILRLLKEGKDVALISDAGTPCLSDPGVHLVNLALEAGIRVSPVPGPSAVVAALSAAGVPTHPFLFLGFLPQRKGRRRRLFTELKKLPYTIVFYESPHRFKDTLNILVEIMPNSLVVAARELTKLYEEIKRGSPAELLEYYSRKGIKGEFTVIVTNKKLDY